MIYFSKELTRQNKINKNFLRKELKQRTNSKIEPIKPDFSEIFASYFLDPEFQNCLESALLYYQDYLNLKYIKVNFDPIKAWNIIGLYLLETSLE